MSNLLFRPTQGCAIQRVMPLVQKLVSDHNGNQSKGHMEPTAQSSGLSKSTQDYQYFTNRLDFSNRKEPQNDVGDLPTWLVEQIDYWSHPKFISIWLVVICFPEGETKAGRLPWHRLHPDGPRQKGMDGCTLSANCVPSTK